MAREVRLALAGDVMLGRGVDQALPHPGDPTLFEDVARSAEDYVALAERAHGPIPRPLDFDAIWGDAATALARQAPDLRLVNLETAVTARGTPAPKGINYRMHPANLPALTAFDVDGCALANNHVLDWGEAGLFDTLDALKGAGVRAAGAGRARDEAEAPAVFPLSDGARVLLFAAALPTSGVPPHWAATATRPGVALLSDLGAEACARFSARVRAVRVPGDVVVVSLHWGPNWGYDVGADQRAFAHGLIDDGAADVVFGHSSHHPKAIEMHRGRAILYGCGDLVNDYEGIAGEQAYRGDLVVLYLVTLAGPEHRCRELLLSPFRLERFRLTTPGAADRRWLHRRLARECARFGGRLLRRGDDAFVLEAA